MFNFNDLRNIIYGPYVPPCERHPYYDDPRDVKPENKSSGDSFREAFASGKIPFSYINQKNYRPKEAWDDKYVNLRRCPKCGTYFQPLNNFDSPYCFDCRE